MKPLWTPIFYKGGNLFVVVSMGFVGRSEEDADFLGEFTGGSLDTMYGATFTGVSLELTGQHPHVRCKLGILPVAVLSGPEFRNARNERA